MASPPIETTISKYAASAVAISSGNATQIGEDIPIDKVRYVIGLVISSSAAQQLEIMLGHTTDPDNETLMLLELVTGSPTTIGSFDIEKPVLVCRPQRAAGGSTITLNQLGIAHETSPINVTATYYDA